MNQKEASRPEILEASHLQKGAFECPPILTRGQIPPQVLSRQPIPPAEPCSDPTTDHCLSKSELARFLGISTRSLDRINAEGWLPAPDFVLGRSPRWSPWTVRKWLRSKPKLRGRGGRHG